MTLADAIAYARAHQPQVVTAKARIAAAEAEAKIPRSQWLPTIGLAAEVVGSTTNNTTATPLSTGGVLDLPRIGGTKATTQDSFDLTPHASSLLGVGVAQEIFDFGRIAAQTSAADAAVDVEKEHAKLAGADVTYEVQSAFYAVQAAKAVVTAAEGAYARSLAHRDLTKAAVDSGLRPPIDLTRAEADLMRFDVGRVRARGTLTSAQTRLAAVVGVSDAALDAAGDAAAEAPPATDASAALRDAEKNDPAILESAARVKEQEARTSAIKAEMRPNLWLTSTFSGRAGGAAPSSGDVPTGQGWLPVVPNWDVGLVLSWRIFDGTVVARAGASKAREEVRRAELSQVREQEIAGLRSALVGDEVARSTLPALARARAAAEANYAQAEARFKQGLATVIELADAEALRTEAEINEAVGKLEAQRARAVIGRATGEDTWKTTTP
jgi:outer membrane protein TolC